MIIETTFAQTGDYLIASVKSRNADTFKVANVQKEMVFRAQSTDLRDDWLNRFSLGQLKHR